MDVCKYANLERVFQTMSGVLDFESVSKVYGAPWSRRRVHALEVFSLSLERGEIFGFLGPNGAGKTTAIHLAMGFMRATEGLGRMLGEPFGHAGSRARVGFLPEYVGLYHRPARALLRFYGALNGMSDPQLRHRCRELLLQVDLEAESDRNVGKFSRGMQQRIGLAQALLDDPELLILDEPTSALVRCPAWRCANFCGKPIGRGRRSFSARTCCLRSRPSAIAWPS